MPESECESIPRFRAALEALARTKKPPEPDVFLATLLLRESVEDEIQASRPSAAALNALSVVDRALRAEAPRFVASPAGGRLREWRNALGARGKSWWWCLDEEDAVNLPGPFLLWLALAGAFFATSLIFMVDFTARVLKQGPDEVGVLSTLIQGFLALLGGGTMITYGRRWLQAEFRRRNVSVRLQGAAIAAMMALLLLLAITIWCSLPSLGLYYNNLGKRFKDEGKVSEAIKRFTRSLRMDPDNSATLYNLANAQEDIQDREGAMGNYRASLANDTKNEQVPAYNNLGRLYILAGDLPASVRLLNRGLSLNPPSASVRYALHKNLAWAYLKMNLVNQAKDQALLALAIRRDGAAAHCILAELFELQPKLGQAQSEWEECLAGAGPSSDVEEEWLGRAEERLRGVERP
jgi:tetratricopeptide (TPR) repeat protein